MNSFPHQKTLLLNLADDDRSCNFTALRSLGSGQAPCQHILMQTIVTLSWAFLALCTILGTGLISGCLTFQRPGRNDTMASDSISSVSAYPNHERNERPDRPIRPLPKRRLRERLSPEVADSIKYPPAPQSTPALFSYPCNLKGNLLEEEVSAGPRDFQADVSGRQSSRRNGNGAGSDMDEVAPRRTVVPRPPTESLGRSVRMLQKPEVSKQGRAPQPPPSASSSVDGYDSFENTNNKKKRKIPTAGEMNGTHGLGDHGLNDSHSHPGGLAVTPERSGENGNSTSVPYYGSGSFVSMGQNVSGPGRGRFGRARNGRSPLQTLSDASGNWLGRGTKPRSATWSPQPGQYHIYPHCFVPVGPLSASFHRLHKLGCFVVLFFLASRARQGKDQIPYEAQTDIVFVLKRKAPALFLTRLPTQKSFRRPKTKRTPAFFTKRHPCDHRRPLQLSSHSRVILRSLGRWPGQGLNRKCRLQPLLTMTHRDATTAIHVRVNLTRHLQVVSTTSRGHHPTAVYEGKLHNPLPRSERTDAVRLGTCKSKPESVARTRHGRIGCTHRNRKTSGFVSSANTSAFLAILRWLSFGNMRSKTGNSASKKKSDVVSGRRPRPEAERERKGKCRPKQTT